VPLSTVWRPLNIVGGVILGLAAFVAIVTARVYLDGKNNFETARRLDREGESKLAIASFEDAARSYFPGSPYPRRALDRLSIKAKAAQMRGDIADAVTIWESIRRSVLATRHVVQPNNDILERAERAIMRLQSLESESEESRETSRIARPRDPSPIASIILFGGLILWIGGAAALCVAPRGKARSTGARVLAWVACLVGLGVWLVICAIA